jgi:predicted ATPase with chaperone activity
MDKFTDTTHATTLAGERFAHVSVTFLRRLPALVIVGLTPWADPQVSKEASGRIRMAIEGAGFEFPRTRIVVEVTKVTKHAPQAIELAIALAILSHDGQIGRLPADGCYVGELPIEGGAERLRQAIATLA